MLYCRYSDLGYNLACILAFPFAQRKSYGKFLIKFSYELSKKEQKLGSPEKPLSDLGAVSYKSYWATELLLALKGYTGSAISIADLCYMTSMLPEDVVPTLKTLKLLVEEENNPGEFVIEAPTEYLDKLLEKYAPKSVYIDLSRLQWIPLYVVDPSIDRWSIQYFKTRGAALCQPSGHNAAVGMAIQGPNGVTAANAMETSLQEEGRLSVSLEEEAMGEDTFSLLEGDEGSSSSSHDDDMVMSFDEEEDPIF